MRRSTASCALLLVLGLFGHELAHAAPAATAAAAAPRGHAAAALTIGVLSDPVTVLNATMWAMLELVRVMQLADEIAEHIKEDIRRRRGDPQRAPGVVPIRPPDHPELAPARRGSPPAARPTPITDTLPARPTS